MGLFSFLSKNKQDSTASDSGYVSRDDDPAAAMARSKRASNAGGGKNRRLGKDGVDPVLPEKKRARRRLVGAIALALGVAVGLPMILDSEPKPLNNDIAIEIPSKERPAAPAASTAPLANANGLDPSEEVIETKPAAASAKPSPALAAPVVAEVKAQSEAVKEAAAAKPPKAEPFDMPKADVKAEAKARAEARARAEAEAQAKAAQRAEARLAAAQAEPKHEPKHDVKPVTKVEDKPKPDDAARALAILEGKPAAKPADKPAEAGAHFVVQIAALATQEKVDELQNKLRDAGIKSYTQKVPTPSGERIRVRMGPFSSRDEAEKARARLVKIGLNGSLVPA